MGGSVSKHLHAAAILVPGRLQQRRVLSHHVRQQPEQYDFAGQFGDDLRAAQQRGLGFRRWRIFGWRIRRRWRWGVLGLTFAALVVVLGARSTGATSITQIILYCL